MNGAGFPRPRIIVSRCLGFEPVRYNAQIIRDDFVRRLVPHCDVVPVCPEVEIGLGTPRPPIRLVREGQGPGLQLLQPSTGRDVTGEMQAFSREFLGSLREVDGFVLKNRSPSCGIHDVKVYAAGADGGVTGKTAGAFGGLVLERFPDCAIEDEGRLRSEALRERFLSLLFGLARLREVEATGSRRALTEFHASYKYMLLAYSEACMRELGRIAASAAERPWEESIALYRATFARAFAKPARLRSQVNALTHAFGHLSDGLSPAERQFFLETLDALRASRTTLPAALLLLRSWVVRFDVRYLKEQACFQPYPDLSPEPV
jgi:uncharacterized protein YbbK (DUF523 family)/uncharacterized protein YbgA (DUF1722 family)